MAFQPLLKAWIDAPSASTLELLLDEIQADDTYVDHSDLAVAVVPLLASGRHAEARDQVLARMPGLFFSPSAHGLLARTYTGLGDGSAAQQEENFAMLAMRNILATGKGTQANPWQVLRINDQYDVLAAHGERAISQSSVDDDGRILDVLETAEGRRWWFTLRNGGRRIHRGQGGAGCRRSARGAARAAPAGM